MLETLILAPLLINGKVVSQEIPYDIFATSELPLSHSMSNSTEENCFVGHQFAVTAPVEERTKCYITVFDKAFVESTGRIVYFERDGALTPVTRQKYYYADVGSEKITSIVTLDNDLSSLITILEAMEGDAIRYGYTSVNDINNAILGYIRSINIDYSDSSELYGFSANNIFYGSQNNDFIEMCESDISHGLTYNNYFGAYLSQNKYSLLDHEWMNDDLIPLHALPFFDPLGSGKTIDLIHMFCSLDGCYSATGKNDFVLFTASILGTEKDMTSWLGDILQACGYYDRLLISNSQFDLDGLSHFEDILENPLSGCSYNDFLADIDAMNIGGAFLAGNQRVSQAVSNYYRYVGQSESNRGALFRTYASMNVTSSSPSLMDLWDKISYYLGFEIDNGICYGTSTYYCDKIVFALSDPFGARDCCVEVREKIGTLLFEYLTPLQS